MFWIIAFVAGLAAGAGAATLYFRRSPAVPAAPEVEPPPPKPLPEPEPEPAADPSDDIAVTTILDTLPLPVWLRRGPDLAVAYCNSACRNILLDTPEDGLRNRMDGHNPPDHALFHHVQLAQRALETGREQTASQTVTIGGSRRLFDIVERPLLFSDTDTSGGDCTIGVGIDQTALVSLQDELGAHVAANDAVLDMMTAAIAIFGADRRLRFYNAAFRQIWRLDAKELAREPPLNAVLDLLRDKRLLPEMVDFPAFKKAWTGRFTSLIEPFEDLWFLPDERVLRLVASPHPSGGLIFTMEDVTDKLALERSYNTATAVQRATLNNLLEAVAVFGSDGRLKLHNRIFRELWGLNTVELDGNPHVSELIDKIERMQPDAGNWPDFRADLMKKITEPSPDSGRMTVGDGRVLDYALVPLPDGDCLAVYVDVTDAAKLQAALVERNRALEKADLVKARFVASMSYEFRTPLNAIIGFGELLRSQIFGPLSERQAGYIDNQLSAAMMLAELINDTLDLAAVQAGTIVVDFTPLDTFGLIGDIARKARERWADMAEITVSGASGLTIAGDTERLRRALGYIVANAVQYSSESGVIDLSVTEEDGFAVVRFVDEFGSLPADDREQIVQTLNTPTHETGEGTIGLRLALSRSLIELHGGSVQADIPETGGLSIICRLPLMKQPD